MRTVEPDDASTPAEAGHAEPSLASAVGFGPCRAGVEILQHLGIGHLGNDAAHHFGDGAILHRIALPDEQVRGDGQIPLVRQPSRHIGDVFMHAEDFRHHQHHRQIGATLRLRPIDGDSLPARVDLDLASEQAVVAGLDRRLGCDRPSCRGEADAKRGADEFPPRTVGAGAPRNEAGEFLVEVAAVHRGLP
jgi:hypothetical protein